MIMFHIQESLLTLKYTIQKIERHLFLSLRAGVFKLKDLKLFGNFAHWLDSNGHLNTHVTNILPKQACMLTQNKSCYLADNVIAAEPVLVHDSDDDGGLPQHMGGHIEGEGLIEDRVQAALHHHCLLLLYTLVLVHQPHLHIGICGVEAECSSSSLHW